MSQKFYIRWCIGYFIIMAILMIVGTIKSWLDLFSGFVMGFTTYSLLIIYRDRKRGSRRLK